MGYGDRPECLGWGDRIDKSDRWLVDLRKCPIGTSDGSSWRIQGVGREGIRGM